MPSLAGSELPKITLDEAYKIASLALARHPSRADFEMVALVPAEEDGFYRMTNVPTFPGAEGIGETYGVNVWTGDVWDMQFCPGRSRTRIVSPAARKLQLAIRKRLGLSEKVYRRLANRRPLCQFP